MAGATNPYHAKYITGTVDTLCNNFHSPHAQEKDIGLASHNGPHGEFNNTMDTVTGLQTINLSED